MTHALWNAARIAWGVGWITWLFLSLLRTHRPRWIVWGLRVDPGLRVSLFGAKKCLTRRGAERVAAQRCGEGVGSYMHRIAGGGS